MVELQTGMIITHLVKEHQDKEIMVELLVRVRLVMVDLVEVVEEMEQVALVVEALVEMVDLVEHRLLVEVL